MGINPCVDVPSAITVKMVATRGYIPVKGKINGYFFEQTLVPVKNAEYRLYVNGPMMKGADVAVGDNATFTIEQDDTPRTAEKYPVPKAFRRALEKNNLLPDFKKLIPSRQKEVLRYLNYLKTEESLLRNVDKVIKSLKQNARKQ